MNKLQEILEEFEILLRTIKPETHNNIEIELEEREKVPLRQFLKTKLVEYAQGKIPHTKTVPPEDSYDLGYNEATFDMADSIVQDFNPTNN